MTVYCDYCGHKAELVDATAAHMWAAMGVRTSRWAVWPTQAFVVKRWRHTQPLIRFGNAAHSAAVAKMPMHGWPGKWHCPSSRPISQCLTNGSASK